MSDGTTAAARQPRGLALGLFVAVVLAHWAEHLVQAVQIYGFGWPVEDALGLLGFVSPGLVRSEWLHWGYNLAVLAGLVALLPMFPASARRWWMAAAAVQCWHFVEHALLVVQAASGRHLLGLEAPTSVLQLAVPRVELHLVYNGVVTALLLVAVVLRWRMLVGKLDVSAR